MSKPNFIVRDAYGVEIPGAAEEFQAILDKVQSDGPPEEGTVRKTRYISGIVTTPPPDDFDTGPLIAKARERAAEARNDPRGIWGTIGTGSNAIIARQIQDTWEQIGAETFERARVESGNPAEPEKPIDKWDPNNWGV